MDYIGIIHRFIDDLVTDKEHLLVKETTEDNAKERLFIVECGSDDMGRLIGKKGSTAEALREVLSIAAKEHKERVYLKIEAFKGE